MYFLPDFLAGYGDVGLSACEVYDMQHDVWKEATPTLKCRTKFASVAAGDGQLFILGGKYIVELEFIVGWKPT